MLTAWLVSALPAMHLPSGQGDDINLCEVKNVGKTVQEIVAFVIALVLPVFDQLDLAAFRNHVVNQDTIHRTESIMNSHESRMNKSGFFAFIKA